MSFQPALPNTGVGLLGGYNGLTTNFGGQSLASNLAVTYGFSQQEKLQAASSSSSSSSSSTSSGVTTFIKTYGGASNDLFTSLRELPSGDYIGCGYTNSFGSGGVDLLITKLTKTGARLWSKVYGGSGNEMASASTLELVSDGGYIVVSSTTSTGNGVADGLILRLDTDGNKLWSRTIGGSGLDALYAIQQTADAGFIAAGRTSSAGPGSNNFLFVKLNSSGSLEWMKVYGETVDNTGISYIKQLTDGGYIAVGGSVVFKLNSAGEIVWAKKMIGGSNRTNQSVVVTSDGKYVIAGVSSYAEGFGGADIQVTVLDSSLGNLEITKIFGDTNSDSILSMQSTDDGNYLITGYVGGQYSISFIKINRNLNIVSTRKFSTGTNNALGYAGFKNQEGGYTFGGYISGI